VATTSHRQPDRHSLHPQFRDRELLHHCYDLRPFFFPYFNDLMLRLVSCTYSYRRL